MDEKTKRGHVDAQHATGQGNGSIEGKLKRVRGRVRSNGRRAACLVPGPWLGGGEIFLAIFEMCPRTQHTRTTKLVESEHKNRSGNGSAPTHAFGPGPSPHHFTSATRQPRLAPASWRMCLAASASLLSNKKGAPRDAAPRSSAPRPGRPSSRTQARSYAMFFRRSSRARLPSFFGSTTCPTPCVLTSHHAHR